MELDYFKKAEKIVEEIRKYEYRLKTIREVTDLDDYSDFQLTKVEQNTGFHNFSTNIIPLSEYCARGLIISLKANYERILQDLYKELGDV